MAKVLIVDDARLSRVVLSDAVSAGGHQVVGEAADGDEAMARYRELRPDVVTLDITMPGRDGIVVLRELLEEDPRARVVMCSAIGEQPKVVEALRAGAREYVVKPVETQQLLQALGRALE